MGVDSTLGIKLIQKETKKTFDFSLPVSHRANDNQILNIFYLEDIRYTSISFKDEKILSDEELELIKLYDDFESEYSETEIISACDALSIFNKIAEKISTIDSNCLLNDLRNRDEVPDDPQSYPTHKHIIEEYIEFTRGLNFIRGVLEVAKQLNCDVQFEFSHW
jgi:hypothetical protein